MIPFETKIEEAAGKKDIRYYLNGVYVDKEKNRVIATDGHIAAIVPLPSLNDEDADASGIIPLDAMKDYRKAGSISILGGKYYVGDKSGNLIDGKFPEIERVIPAEQDCEHHRVSIDASLLLALAKALHNPKQKCLGVTLCFPKDSGNPILVKPFEGVEPGAIGVLMPLRDKKKSKK